MSFEKKQKTDFLWFKLSVCCVKTHVTKEGHTGECVKFSKEFIAFGICDDFFCPDEQ